MSFASNALREHALRTRELSKFTSDARALKAIEEQSAELMARADEMDRLNSENDSDETDPSSAA
ncbi:MULTISPECIES: hypothetical protein [Brevundimonas]|uniref:hypothetical protein n=1 Tax=Brevundimonas TaxID=41275 RepID=UPI0011AFF44C|nr:MULTISPECIES: hypothetical protein [Brevundimonas]MCK6103177.1 hypothetical protein [Brevundimonas sp. EYE_349]